MLKIVTIIGARPQIIKASAISRAVRNHFPDKIEELIVHTGQHYDFNMSEVFFRDMQVPEPYCNLDVKSGKHGEQTAAMIKGLENVLEQVRPDGVIIYGDTNSTLAGSLAASKLFIPVIHIEAGLRSFNKSMPEEINRIVCDHVSTLLFSPTPTGVKNLLREGFSLDNLPPYSIDNPRVYHCGDIMYDNTLFFSGVAERKSDILTFNDIHPGKYILATIHRPGNTDDPQRLNSIFRALSEMTRRSGMMILMPLHPRTQKLLPVNLEKEVHHDIMNNSMIRIIEPVSFLDMILLEKHAAIIVTDSGGVQKEAYFMMKPSIIVRPETEWVEIVESGSAMVTDADTSRILDAFSHFTNHPDLVFPPVFGDGNAASFICDEIIKNLI